VRTCELKNSDNLCVSIPMSPCTLPWHHFVRSNKVMCFWNFACPLGQLWNFMQIHFICSFGWFGPFKKVVRNIFSFWGQFLLFCDCLWEKRRKIWKNLYLFFYFFFIVKCGFSSSIHHFREIKKLKKEKTLVATIWSQFLIDHLEL
jgi:hypothetical protein